MAELEAQEVLESGYSEAERVIKDPDALDKLLRDLEEKLKTIPDAGDTLSNVPVMISMMRSYASKEYTDFPLGTLLAIVSALLYVLSPFDLIPDAIPIAGYFDDAAIVAACLGLVQIDVNNYKAWRESR